MDKGMSIRAYAEHRKNKGLPGGSAWSVKKALRDQRIIRNEHGKIDPEIADQQWEQNTSPAQQRTGRSSIATTGGGTGPGHLSIPSYAQSRAVKEAYQARIARLQYEEMTGQLVRVDSVKVEAFRTARRVRDQILAIPDRLAPLLAAEDDALEVNRLLVGELRAALEALADG